VWNWPFAVYDIYEPEFAGEILTDKPGMLVKREEFSYEIEEEMDPFSQ